MVKKFSQLKDNIWLNYMLLSTQNKIKRQNKNPKEKKRHLIWKEWKLMKSLESTTWTERLTYGEICLSWIQNMQKNDSTFLKSGSLILPTFHTALYCSFTFLFHCLLCKLEVNWVSNSWVNWDHCVVV